MKVNIPQWKPITGLVMLSALIPAVSLQAEWKPVDGPLMTRWAGLVTPENARPEYPRPQLVRGDWVNLNGLWDFGVGPREGSQPVALSRKILVPFPVESALSGVMQRVSENERIWYRRSFDLPHTWVGKRVILHFGAVDFETTVWVNGQEVGQHRGGYDSFSFDITAALKRAALNEIVVAVWDPTDAGTQPRGKQVRNPHGIWYVPTSGIWQTVWLEAVNSAHVTGLRVVPDIDRGVVKVRVDSNARLGTYSVVVSAWEKQRKLAQVTGRPGAELELPISKARLWSPEDPHLYDLKVQLRLGSRTLDRVESYFGMRKISLGKDKNGFTRLMLNNKPHFQFGPLDQGFWPDGLYTAPTESAMVYDLEVTKNLGYNMIRKHVKVEPDRWYYWCDRMGLLVWQDMPSGDKYIGGNDPDVKRTPESAAQFEMEYSAMIRNLFNHPSIVMWVPFNEGWGQYDSVRITELTRHLDPTRLVNHASGWTDRGVGDVNDIHRYPGPGAPAPETNRATVLGEFGGLGLPIRGHTWQSERNWGYRSFTNRFALNEAYIDLASKLFPLIEEKGLSAAVYTQTTDVEVEVNGLMTYDRAILKMDDRIPAVNRGQVPPRPRLQDVVPSAQTEKSTWRYTLEKPADDWFKPGFNAGAWQQGVSGFGTRGTSGAAVRTVWDTKAIWLRRDFSINAADLQGLRLLIHHDEEAEVYINGEMAAALTGFTTDYRQAAISPAALAAIKPTGNVLAVTCRHGNGGQYIDVGLVREVLPGK